MRLAIDAAFSKYTKLKTIDVFPPAIIPVAAAMLIAIMGEHNERVPKMLFINRVETSTKADVLDLPKGRTHADDAVFPIVCLISTVNYTVN